jgi:hypothetical protein
MKGRPARARTTRSLGDFTNSNTSGTCVDNTIWNVPQQYCFVVAYLDCGFAFDVGRERTASNPYQYITIHPSLVYHQLSLVGVGYEKKQHDVFQIPRVGIVLST